MNLVRRMKAEIKDEIESRMTETYSTKQEMVEMYSTKQEMIEMYSTKQKIEYIFLVAKYTSIQFIEDWCLDCMKYIVRIKGDATHKQTVETFLKSYNAIDVFKEYLISLKSPAERDTAIDFIDINPLNNDAVNSLWKSLKCQLSQDDVQKYKALMKFNRE